MSDQSSEPDKYSLDEMMDRLRGRDGEGSSEGELVTRADGTRAMKVKKRRRRTDQAVNKETQRNQRVQILQIAGFVILVVVLGLVAGIGIVYANSSPFRDDLISKVESTSGAKVEFKQFRINPATANSNLVTFDWPAGNVLSSLQLQGIVGKIAPACFLGKAFTGEEIVAVNGELVLRKPVAGEAVRNSEKVAGAPVVRFDRYFTPLLDIYFGDEKSSLSMLSKTEASLFPGSVPGHGELRLSGGALNMAGWPALALDRSYMIFNGQDLDVKSLRLEIPVAAKQKGGDPGYIELSGIVQPLESKATQSLAVELHSFRVSYLLGADLGRFFLGRVDTDEVSEKNFLSLPVGKAESAAIELSTSNSPGSRMDLSGFPFLANLSRLLEERWYELPNFDDHVSMVISRKGESVEIKEFALEERGRMAVRGTISNGEAGQISGKIMVGVPESTILVRKSELLERIFARTGEGFRWIDLEIGGTSAAPTDNFLDLFSGAKVGVENSEQNTQSQEVDSFESLISPE